MDFVEGRIFKDVTLAELSGVNDEQKGAIYSAMSGVLAAIHRLDYNADELRDYGKTDGAYLKRNLGRWASQVSVII